jgi:hypothetical protein
MAETVKRTARYEEQLNIEPCFVKMPASLVIQIGANEPA